MDVGGEGGMDVGEVGWGVAESGGDVWACVL